MNAPRRFILPPKKKAPARKDVPSTFCPDGHTPHATVRKYAKWPAAAMLTSSANPGLARLYSVAGAKGYAWSYDGPDSASRPGVTIYTFLFGQLIQGEGHDWDSAAEDVAVFLEGEYGVPTLPSRGRERLGQTCCALGLLWAAQGAMHYGSFTGTHTFLVGRAIQAVGTDDWEKKFHDVADILEGVSDPWA